MCLISLTSAPGLCTPKAGFSGPDSFTYKASDGRLASNIATVSITVKASGIDTVTITLAEYKTKTRQLTVQATSTLQPGPTLTVIGFGDMTYNVKAKKYALTKRVASAPSSVTVTSSSGGSATRAVTGR